ncbi:MAG: hypothetical protein DCF20_09475 [Pseudanabaena sp.]|nr:MAG: hypothetical protein DCF20_09475 [Pseudanabaena sp.]
MSFAHEMIRLDKYSANRKIETCNQSQTDLANLRKYAQQFSYSYKTQNRVAALRAATLFWVLA